MGMSKDEVLQSIGKPTLVEMDEVMEWWLYLTTYSSYSTHTGQYVPVVFEDGKLIGWGANYWNNLRRSDTLENQPITQDSTICKDANCIEKLPR
jgi:outer membrane protein assembly factor BamE (lipoprotein component of BamABCDE complex)